MNPDHFINEILDGIHRELTFLELRPPHNQGQSAQSKRHIRILKAMLVAAAKESQ